MKIQSRNVFIFGFGTTKRPFVACKGMRTARFKFPTGVYFTGMRLEKYYMEVTFRLPLPPSEEKEPQE